jgi:hypothetical protein
MDCARERPPPRLANECRAVGGHRGDLRLGKFQYDFAALDLVNRTEQARISAVGYEHFEDEAIDRLAGDRHRDQRQLHDRSADVGRFRRRQLDNIEDQSRAIVGAAGVERSRNQRPGGIFGSRPLA